MKEIKIHSLLLFIFILFSGLGIVLFLPTITSFMAYKKIEKSLDNCIQQLEKTKEISKVHKLIFECGLDLRQRHVKQGMIVEEFSLPLYFVDSQSDEDFFLRISFNNDSIIGKIAVWHFHSNSKEMKAFSNKSRNQRKNLKNRHFGKIFFLFCSYIVSCFFLFIIAPRLLSFVRSKPLSKQIIVSIIVSFLIIISMLGLIVSIIVLMHTRWHSLILLPKQISFLKY